MVLITGATGFVGSHLALHLLRQGEPVRAIYRNELSRQYTLEMFRLYSEEKLFEKIEWLQADITDIPSLENAFASVTEVYHCAAFISFNRADEVILRKVNIEGTANIVNFCIAYNVRKLCYVSSIAALGDPKEHEAAIDEETEWNPEKYHSDYAITKFGAEMEIWRGQQEGLQTVIVNPGVILGPVPQRKSRKQSSSDIINAVANGLPFYTKGATGFVAVSDVVEIMYQLMKSDSNGERYLIIERTYIFQYLVSQIAATLGVKPPSMYANASMTSIAWRIDWLLGLFGKKRLLYRDMARALHSTDKFSNLKIRTILSYEFKDIPSYIAEIAAQQKRK